MLHRLRQSRTLHTLTIGLKFGVHFKRLWKFVKKNCLYSAYYENFALFKNAISTCLSQTRTTHKAALDTLLTLRFQTFEESQIVRG